MYIKGLKMKLVRYFFMFFLVMANSALAKDSCSAEGVCSDVSVEKVYVIPASKYVNVGTSGRELDIDSGFCTVYQNYYLQLDIESASGKEAYSALLAAQMAEKRVTISTVQGSSPCLISYLTISN